MPTRISAATRSRWAKRCSGESTAHAGEALAGDGQGVPQPPQFATSAEVSSTGLPAWAWLVGVAAIAGIVVAVFRRGGRSGDEQD